MAKKNLVPVSEAKEFGSKPTLIAWGLKYGFPIFKLGESYKVDLDAAEVWLQDRQAGRSAAFVDSIRGTGETRTMPSAGAAKNARDAMLIIGLAGHAPSDPYWRNARSVRGDIDPGTAAIFDLPCTAFWSLAVEQAERFLGMPDRLRQAELARMQTRFAEFLSLHAMGLAS